MICSSEKRFFTSNLLLVGDWTPNRCATQKRGGVDDATIYRHHPFADGWEWSYPECRIQLKAMVRALGRPVPLYKVSDRQIEQAYGGSLFYRSVLKGPLLTEPSLEDYAMTPSESRRSRESAELPLVVSYMREHGI